MDMEGLGISDIIEDEEIEVMGTGGIEEETGGTEGGTDEETEVMGTGSTDEETEGGTDEETEGGTDEEIEGGREEETEGGTDEETEVTTPEESSTVFRIDFTEGVISPDNRFCSFLRPG